MTGKLQLDGTFIDVRVEVKDGVLVFSPINDYSQFKDGDVITCGWENKTTSCEWVCVLRGQIEVVAPDLFMEDYCSLDLKDLSGRHELLVNPGFSDSATYVRHATEEEKKQLFDALAKEGKMWDAEKKEVVDLKWKPSEWNSYYFSRFSTKCKFIVDRDVWFDDKIHYERYDADMVFPCTNEGKAQCQALCDKLNQAIKEVKL